MKLPNYMKNKRLFIENIISICSDKLDLLYAQNKLTVNLDSARLQLKLKLKLIISMHFYCD